MIRNFTLPDILDNSDDAHVVTNALNNLLAYSPNAFVASGFFNLAGYSLVRDGLARAKSVRIMIGKEPSGSSGDSGELDVEVLTDELAGDLGMTLSAGLRDKRENVTHFLRFLQRDSVQVHLYRRRFFHAKAYIFDDVPPFGTVAIVGSSNFTAAGLTGNTELNMAQKQATIAREFLRWFERIWSDTSATIDFKPTMIELYSRGVALHSPYLIYMKSLWEALSDKLGSDLLPPQNERPSPIVLADFQHDGYLAAKEILETYNGVLIADPVGLGKTYLALRLLDDYAYQLRQKALVICPAQLRNVWWEPKLDAYRIYAEIESQERVSQADFAVDQYADADVIVVDECHNFRNPGANRWQNLLRLMTTGKPKKLVLLTATPINTNLFDLYNQLRLLTRDRPDYFAAVGIPDLFQYFRSAKEEQERILDLLDAIAVRRSRDFICRNYPDAKIDGKAVHFPERKLHAVNYNLEQTYEGLYSEIAQAIDGLYLAPYSLDSYRRDVPRQLRFDWGTEGTKSLFESLGSERSMQLARQVALVGIMKTLYLKRLESSVRALQISFQRACRFQQRFLEQLKAGRLLTSKAFHRLEALLRIQEDSDDQNSDEDDALDHSSVDASVSHLMETLESVDPAAFYVSDIAAAVEHDIDVLSRIVRKLESVSYDQDDKLVALKCLLTQDLRGHKAIVFTYFRDTARYIWQALQADPEFRQDLGHSQISFAHGDLDRHERRERIQCFAPKASGRPEIIGTDKEIQLLISTDVLSEGQNLQDAGFLVNYDLHWNPVRMVQRAGRIDRLGSSFEQIHLHNFIPEDALESLLSLVQTLRERLEAINQAGLLDAPVMGELPTPRDFNAIRRIAANDDSVLVELESLSELDAGEFLRQELLEFMKRAGEEKLRSLPLGVGTGKRSPNGRRGLYVHLRGGAQHFHLLFDATNNTWENRRFEIFKLVRSLENEPAQELDFDIYPIIQRAKKRVVDQVRQAQIRLPRLIPPQNHTVSWLKGQDSGEDIKIRSLVEYFSTPLPDPQIRRLRRIWNQHRTDSKTLLEALRIFVADNPVLKVDRPTIADMQEEDLALVCYMALV